MLSNNITLALNEVRKKSPLIHAITNPISINQCANAALALGARPIMAEHPKEVAGITATAQALLLNLGNITDTRMESMKLSAKVAKENNIPVILDLVGVACSGLRRDFATELTESCMPCVIKGNYSEIYAFYNESYTGSGVDADATLSADTLDGIAVKLQKTLGCVILASGKTDIICGENALVHVNNGTPRLSTVTGTGCMLGMLTACFLSASDSFTAATAACGVLGISGEKSVTKNGSGTFLVNLLDRLSTICDEDIYKFLKTEER